MKQPAQTVYTQLSLKKMYFIEGKKIFFMLLIMLNVLHKMKGKFLIL